MTLVRAHALSGGYEPGRDVLTGVDFELPAGRIAAVLGPNGGGKTTLFNALLGELPVRRGTVELAGAPALVPQTHRARLDFPVSALDVAMMGAYHRTPWWRRIPHAERERALAALRRVDLAPAADTRFGALSGGQRQRVMIARALVHGGRVMLLDEPLSGVDAVSASRIERLLTELRDEGHAILIATHDVAQASTWDACLCLNGRQIAYGDPAETLTPDVLRDTYGSELIVLADGGVAVRLGHHEHNGHDHD